MRDELRYAVSRITSDVPLKLNDKLNPEWVKMMKELSGMPTESIVRFTTRHLLIYDYIHETDLLVIEGTGQSVLLRKTPKQIAIQEFLLGVTRQEAEALCAAR